MSTGREEPFEALTKALSIPVSTLGTGQAWWDKREKTYDALWWVLRRLRVDGLQQSFEGCLVLSSLGEERFLCPLEVAREYRHAIAYALEVEKDPFCYRALRRAVYALARAIQAEYAWHRNRTQCVN